MHAPQWRKRLDTSEVKDSEWTERNISRVSGNAIVCFLILSLLQLTSEETAKNHCFNDSCSL